MINDYINNLRKRDEATYNSFISTSGEKEIMALGINERDAKIFLRRIKEHEKLKEIAADHNLTIQRIRQILAKVRRKIIWAGR